MVDIATKWNIRVWKYQEVMETLKKKYWKKTDRSVKRPQAQQLVRALKGPFIKMEDKSRKYRPEFLEFKSFPYIDFSTSTGSPFDKWFKE